MPSMLGNLWFVLIVPCAVTLIILLAIRKGKQQDKNERAYIQDTIAALALNDEEEITLDDLEAKAFRQLNLALMHLDPKISFKRKSDEEDCYLLIHVEVADNKFIIYARTNVAFNFLKDKKTAQSSDLTPRALNRVFEDLDIDINLLVKAA